ncbi:uncharacterized protein LOC135155240 [Lytechinus pictus]|uniref:uncharacterized protein LOC135155240 n=1 Tax=Lytechinus pictus TaxID=7653 RepID=UPI0030B9BF93
MQTDCIGKHSTEINMVQYVDKLQFREAVLTEVSSFDLEHILRGIGKEDNISMFLESLGIDPTQNTNEGGLDFLKGAQDKLDKWAKETRDINPVIILSSTLEKLNHTSANNFFQVNDEKKINLRDNEIEIYARKYTRNHYNKVSTLIQHCPFLGKVVRENNDYLLNTENMLHDWWTEQQCNYYRRRCILDETLPEQKLLADTKPSSLRTGPGDDQWPSDDELKVIDRYIDHKYTAHVRECLDVSTLSESDNKNDLFGTLCAWRQSFNGDFTTMYRKLVFALKDTNIYGLLSPVRNDAIHNAEIVEIAFNLLMTDILPVVKHLRIIETKLLSYRPAFQPSHLQKGTIGLVSTLITSVGKNKQREELCRRLKDGGFSGRIQLNIIARQMSYGELSTIFNTQTTCISSANEEKEAPQQEPQEGDHLLTQEKHQAPDPTTATLEPEVKKDAESTKGFNRIKNILRSNSSKQSPDTTQQEMKSKEGSTSLGKSVTKTLLDTAIAMEPIVVQAVESSPEVTERTISSNETIVNIEPDAITSEVCLHLSEIKQTLNLSDEDVCSWVGGNLDEFTLFQIWKAKTRFSAISERASVIKCMHDSGKGELARSVIEGKFIPEEISLSFVKHVIQTAGTNSKLEKLAASLDLKKEFLESKSSVDAISEIIQKRLVTSMKGSENIPGDGSGASKKSKKDKDVKSQMGPSQVHNPANQADKLVEYGFMDLARELLIIYQNNTQ